MQGGNIKKLLTGGVYVIAGCILMYVLFTNIVSTLQQNTEIAALEKAKDKVVSEKKDLKKEISLLNDDDYVTRYARENYVFTRDGEQVAIIPNVDTDNDK